MLAFLSRFMVTKPLPQGPPSPALSPWPPFDPISANSPTSISPFSLLDIPVPPHSGVEWFFNLTSRGVGTPLINRGVDKRGWHSVWIGTKIIIVDFRTREKAFLRGVRLQPTYIHSTNYSEQPQDWQLISPPPIAILRIKPSPSKASEISFCTSPQIPTSLESSCLPTRSFLAHYALLEFLASQGAFNKCSVFLCRIRPNLAGFVRQYVIPWNSNIVFCSFLTLFYFVCPLVFCLLLDKSSWQVM